MRVAFTPGADLALARFGQNEQITILHNLQEAVQMCETGNCTKLTKLTRIPHLYRVVCGDFRVIGTRFNNDFLVTDVLRRNEKTYRFYGRKGV